MLEKLVRSDAKSRAPAAFERPRQTRGGSLPVGYLADGFKGASSNDLSLGGGAGGDSVKSLDTLPVGKAISLPSLLMSVYGIDKTLEAVHAIALDGVIAQCPLEG